MEALAGSPSSALKLEPSGLRFEAETIAAAASVRETLSALIADLPGEARTPRELQRVLGVDYKICWQVISVIRAADPLKAAKHTPTAQALKRLLSSSFRLGVARERIDAVQSAIEQFSSVVRKHAGDRPTLQAMVSAAAEGGEAAPAISYRRSAFRAMSQIWGAQVEAHLRVNFVRKAESGDRLDECSISIKRGFHRLRASASSFITSSRPSLKELPADQLVRRPLDLDAAKKVGAPILPAFSSDPLPKLRTEPGASGWLNTRLAESGIGRQSRVNLAFGMATIGQPFSSRTGGKSVFRAGSASFTPTGLLIMDMLVHRPSFGSVTPEVMAFQCLPGEEQGILESDAPQLVVDEEVMPLGSAHLAVDHPEWPGYTKVLLYVTERMGWNLAEFDIYRLRIEYPVLGSLVRTQLEF